MSKTYKPKEWVPEFIAALAEVPVLAYACKAAGVERSTVWRTRQTDPEFDAEVIEAMEAGVDKAEQEAFRRAVAGYEEPLSYQGRITYHIEHFDADTGAVVSEADWENNLALPLDKRKALKWRYKLDAAGNRMPVTVRKHSDALLSLILKGRRKNVYAERKELTGADGAALPAAQVVIATGVPSDDFSDLA